MKLKLVTLVFALLIVAPMAQAQDTALINTQYYGHLRDTCKKNNVDRVWIAGLAINKNLSNARHQNNGVKKPPLHRDAETTRVEMVIANP